MKRNIKKYLSQIGDSDELRDLILKLHDHFPEVQDYLKTLINPESTKDLFNKYKRVIEKEFDPYSNGFRAERVSVAKKAILDYKKSGAPLEAVAELMLFYVETALQSIREYGTENDKLPNSVIATFTKALEIISDNTIERLYNRCFEISEHTDLGWGLFDLGQLCYDYLPLDEET